MDIENLIRCLRKYIELLFEENTWCDEANVLYDTMDVLHQLYDENKKLRTELTMQTALAQNVQSAIDTSKRLAQEVVKLKKERDDAISDLKEAFIDNEVCNFCNYQHHCEEEQCDKYMTGKGVHDENGKYYDWEWSCMDFDWGTCDKLENTPCNGCDLINNFEWRGVKDE